MKKLLLVQPTTKDTVDKRCYSGVSLATYLRFLLESRLKSYLTEKRAINIPPLSSMILSSLTRSYKQDCFEINFVDEKVEPLDFDCGADLVAISANTTMSKRTYEISSEFKKRGAKTVIGGIHASVMPDEVLQHADAVVIGEAEYVWHDILSDFLSGNLKGTYRAGRLLDMKKDYVLPDFSILKQEYYLGPSIEMSRGCPHSCSFCSAPIIFGTSYRRRELSDIISQVESASSDYLYFADDNGIGDPQFAKKLFKELKRLNKRWAGSASTLLVNDDELRDLIIESGCKFLVVGFESTAADALDNVKKRHNSVDKYGGLVRSLQDNGILVAASFILGFDGETKESIQALQSYVEEQGFLFYVPGVLIPYPGTALFDKYQQEGRLLHKEWNLYNVKAGVPVTSDRNCMPYPEEYLALLKKTVKTNGISYLVRKMIENPGFIAKLSN